MSRTESIIPETHVLAIASHVTSGYVGNTMATFCMQSLGCEVSAIHTVNYSNHVGYKHFKGRRSTPEEVAELYAGLRENGLDRFDMMLSGYCPSAALVEQVGRIARDLKLRANTQPGSFFWVLDPVMGDNGHMYVAQETLPIYKSLLRDADLILPNQYEAEILSGVPITDLTSMHRAVATLHERHQLPHVVITSIRLPAPPSSAPDHPSPSSAAAAASALQASDSHLSIIGSTATSTHHPRLFRITVPSFPVFFSGTGDMFAALLVARLREEASASNLLGTASWRSPDEEFVEDPENLPLAKAAEKVLASMHAVLRETAERVEGLDAEEDDGEGKYGDRRGQEMRERRITRAAEVRVVRNSGWLRDPPRGEGFRARRVGLEGGGEGE